MSNFKNFFNNSLDEGEVLPPTHPLVEVYLLMKIPLFIVQSSIGKKVVYNLIIEVNIHNITHT